MAAAADIPSGGGALASEGDAATLWPKLEHAGFEIIGTAGDGNCFYDAFFRAVIGSPDALREQVIAALTVHIDKNATGYSSFKNSTQEDSNVLNSLLQSALTNQTPVSVLLPPKNPRPDRFELFQHLFVMAARKLYAQNISEESFRKIYDNFQNNLRTRPRFREYVYYSKNDEKALTSKFLGGRGKMVSVEQAFNSYKELVASMSYKIWATNETIAVIQEKLNVVFVLLNITRGEGGNIATANFAGEYSLSNNTKTFTLAFSGNHYETLGFRPILAHGVLTGGTRGQTKRRTRRTRGKYGEFLYKAGYSSFSDIPDALRAPFCEQYPQVLACPQSYDKYRITTELLGYLCVLKKKLLAKGELSSTEFIVVNNNDGRDSVDALEKDFRESGPLSSAGVRDSGISVTVENVGPEGEKVKRGIVLYKGDDAGYIVRAAGILGTTLVSVRQADEEPAFSLTNELDTKNFDGRKEKYEEIKQDLNRSIQELKDKSDGDWTAYSDAFDDKFRTRPTRRTQFDLAGCQPDTASTPEVAEVLSSDTFEKYKQAFVERIYPKLEKQRLQRQKAAEKRQEAAEKRQKAAEKRQKAAEKRRKAAAARAAERQLETLKKLNEDWKSVLDAITVSEPGLTNSLGEVPNQEKRIESLTGLLASGDKPEEGIKGILEVFNGFAKTNNSLIGEARGLTSELNKASGIAKRLLSLKKEVAESKNKVAGLKEDPKPATWEPYKEYDDYAASAELNPILQAIFNGRDQKGKPIGTEDQAIEYAERMLLGKYDLSIQGLKEAVAQAQSRNSRIYTLIVKFSPNPYAVVYQDTVENAKAGKSESYEQANRNNGIILSIINPYLNPVDGTLELGAAAKKGGSVRRKRGLIKTRRPRRESSSAGSSKSGTKRRGRFARSRSSPYKKVAFRQATHQHSRTRRPQKPRKMTGKSKRGRR